MSAKSNDTNFQGHKLVSDAQQTRRLEPLVASKLQTQWCKREGPGTTQVVPTRDSPQTTASWADKSDSTEATSLSRALRRYPSLAPVQWIVPPGHRPYQRPTKLEAHLEKISLSCGYCKCSPELDGKTRGVCPSSIRQAHGARKTAVDK